MSDATELLTPAEVSASCQVSAKTLTQWRYLGRGPAYVKVGKHVRYRRSDVDAWLEAQTIRPAEWGEGMSDELHRFPPLVATHADHLRAQLAAEGERADKAEAKADRLLRDVTREASRRVLAETERDNQRDRADKAETERDEYRRRAEQAEATLEGTRAAYQNAFLRGERYASDLDEAKRLLAMWRRLDGEPTLYPEVDDETADFLAGGAS